MPPNLWNLQLFANKGQALSLQPTCCGYCDFRKDQWQNMWSLVCETPENPHIHLRWCMGKWAKSSKRYIRYICSSASIAAPASFQDFPETRCGLWFCHSITTLSTKRSSSSTWNWRNSKECWYQQEWPQCGNLCILRFLFLTPPLGTFDLIMKSWQVEPVLYHLTSEVPQWKASICAAHQAPWG